MDSNPLEEHIDAVVDHLLKDQDFLLSRELRHRMEELNQLLVQAHAQHMKVEFDVKSTPSQAGGAVTHVDIAVYKEI